ncbi:glycosyltransferase family 4 protein [Salimicrobium album]|uniref:Glycosyltransferase involved in cell wall bisynthesis n=1 Tax=Salimicrobium album TaxID=50717 RepID=A0A1H3EL75_9BACI|nr:glycosyltransferase family 4 protein [Salimicrobium album]SDX79317.1 Glycosyltransferase involved in cell wall bisynthesis [Salimicrobium album]
MKIAVLSSHTSSLFWFRMDMMKDFIKQGHSVIAVGSELEAEWRSKFEENGIQYKQLFVERNGINPFKDLRTYRELKKFMKEEKPDKVFAYQAKTVVHGCLAAKANNIKEVYPLIAGLGSIFRGTGIKNKIIKTVMKVEYRLACNASKKVFFQNNDDMNEFINNGLVQKEKVVIINGSGVNLKKFQPEPLPVTPTFLFIGRLIKDKGVVEYLKACKRIKVNYPEVRCILVGPFDSNPSSIQPDELQPYIDNDVIEYVGEKTDVRPYLKQCTTYILPSYHEGTPKTVLEAMATGRSIITSDAPGCRETVTDGYNGFLIPVKDVNSLVDKMEILINDQEKNQIIAKNSLKLAKEKYDVKLINSNIMKTMGIL